MPAAHRGPGRAGDRGALSSRSIATFDARVVDRVGVDLRCNGVSLMPPPFACTLRAPGELAGTLRHRVLELGLRHDFVDQPPVDRAFALTPSSVVQKTSA